MKNINFRSALFLVIIFTLGLSVGYIGQINPGYNLFAFNSTAIKELHSASLKRLKAVDSSKTRTSLPRHWKEAEGTVFDCVTWREVYKYDVDAILRNYRLLPEVTGTAEADDHRQKSFADIFHQQTWGGRQAGVSDTDPNYKASGPGSALDMSQGVIAVLHTMIDRLKTQLNKTVIKILDLPCGDHQYMSHFLKTRTDIDYTGADIVPELIQKHINTYKGRKNIHFKNIDIVKDELQESYDLILCRLMTQHLMFNDVLKTLYHFSSSNSSYLATTTFHNSVNKEVGLSGYRFRHLNLEKAPINLSPPVCTYLEPVPNGEHYMAIWTLPLLQHV